MDPRRAARRDLGEIDAGRAQEVLREVEPVLRGEVRRVAKALLMVAGLGEDDLLALARIAALEAALSHEEGRGTLRAWVRRHVRWRLGEALDRAPDREAPLPEVLVNGRGPEETAQVRARAVWLQGAVAKLPPRHRTLVAAKLAGESQRTTARTLGISDGYASQQLQQAIRRLHARALAEGWIDE
jgi:RNA polymerase sigma factor (sigma-70 family)